MSAVPVALARLSDTDRSGIVLRFLASPNEVEVGGRTIKAGHVLE